LRERFKRHITGTALATSLFLGVLLEYLFCPGQAMLDLGQDGTLIGLFGSLAGFLIAGLTILLTLVDHEALMPIRGSVAESYILRSFVWSIWTQSIALVFSIVIRLVPNPEKPSKALIVVWSWLGHSIFLITIASVVMLFVAVFFLSLVVHKITKHKADEAAKAKKETQQKEVELKSTQSKNKWLS